MSYSWQHPQWPRFTWSESPRRVATMSKYAELAGRLAGSFSVLQRSDRLDALTDLMVSEAIHTSMIEGEHLDREDVRSSIKRYLGLPAGQPVRDQRAAGVAALMVDVRRTHAQPLTVKRLLDWNTMVLPDAEHRMLHPVTPGLWRQGSEPMQIVSDPIGYETVHYEAPPAARVPALMDELIAWYHDTGPGRGSSPIPGPIRAAIAHLWFEQIHPFEDGNGRVGRAVAEHALGQDLDAPPMLSLSSVIEKRRDEYYEQLQLASHSLDITPWVDWFCDLTLEAQYEAMRTVDYVLQKTRFWDTYRTSDLNDRQVKVINKLFDHLSAPEGFVGGLSARKYVGMTGCSKATATRDLRELVEMGCLVESGGGGRSVRYELNVPASGHGLEQFDIGPIEGTPGRDMSGPRHS